MTNKEIMQALRICATHKEKGCGLCPQMKYVRCTERLADEAITIIERLTAENAKAEAERDALRRGWMSVDDKLPAPGTRVIATDGVFVGEAIYALDGRWSGYGGGILRDCLGSVITHWMPMPSAPKEDAT